jgi:hypothetical protein
MGKQPGIRSILNHQHESNDYLMLPTIIESLMGTQFSTIQFQEPDAYPIPLIESCYTNSTAKNPRITRWFHLKLRCKVNKEILFLETNTILYIF